MAQVDREAPSRELAQILSAADRAKKRGAVDEHKNYVLYAAGILRRVGELERAIETLLAARMYAEAAVIAEESGDWLRAAQIWFRDGDFGRSAEAYEKTGDHAHAADLYARVGAHSRAARAFLRCDQQLKAGMAYERAGDHGRAAQCLVAALKNRARYGLDGAEAERVCRAAASCYERNGDVDRAVRILELGDQKLAAAEILRRAGRVEEATRIVEEHEALHTAEVFLARARAGDRASYGRAIQALATIEPSQRVYRSARVMMARALIEDDDRACALRVLKRLLDERRFTTEDLPALRLYARLLIEAGQSSEARATLHTILELAPDNNEAEAMLDALGENDAPIPIETQTLAQTLVPATARRAFVGMTLRERFTIRERLGEGAQAAVFLAHDVVLDREVAIKILSQELALDVTRSEAFLQEARFAARVHHRGCLRVYDFGVDQGVIFMAMELSDGHALSELLRGRLPASRAIPIAREVASALAAIHEAGIVHRDVKPANILIDSHGGVRLADFGVATSLEGDGRDASSGAVGTLRYMAPEQADPTAIDPRSDVYSVGAVLFEMLAGAPAFEGTVQSLLQRLLTPAPELPVDVRVSAEAAGVLRACLAPDPDERWPTMRALYDALAALG